MTPDDFDPEPDDRDESDNPNLDPDGYPQDRLSPRPKVRNKAMLGALKRI